MRGDEGTITPRRFVSVHGLSSGTNLAKNELRSRETLDEFNSWRQRLPVDLLRSETEQTAADAFELCGIGARKDFDPRPVFGPPMRRPSKRAQGQVGVGGGDPARS